jgi:hypothetical protein
MKKLKNPGGSNDSKIILLLEKKIGTKLPEDYRLFLLENDGGAPMSDGIPVPQHAEKVMTVQILFGFNRDIESSCIEWNMYIFRERIPDNLMPIGSSDSGDLYLINLSGDDYGKIYFWDHEDECGKNCWDNIYFVASSFSEFLEKLTDEI